MGGVIGVRSSLGNGSTFFFSLPVQIAKAPEEQLTTKPTTESVAIRKDVEGGVIRVLVVDDVKMNRKLLVKVMLRMNGFQCDEAEDGAVAVDLCSRNRCWPHTVNCVSIFLIFTVLFY